MKLPDRPESIQELQTRLSSGELRESRSLELKRELPSNKRLAKQLAGFAAEGGVLVIGVEETPAGLEIRPLDCAGARERVEHVALDTTDPPVHIESHILLHDTDGHGVLWIEIPPSSAMVHQVDGTYFGREDTQTRPMPDPEVADRMRLRNERDSLVRRLLETARFREEPGDVAWSGRMGIVARPIGAAEQELYESTRTPEDWKSFNRTLAQPIGMLPPTANRFWGILKTYSEIDQDRLAWSQTLSRYRDIYFHEEGAFSLVSYCCEWLPDQTEVIRAYRALLACCEALFIIGVVQRRTGQRRMWDLAFSVSDVRDLRAMKRTEGLGFDNRIAPRIPRHSYQSIVTGVSALQLERHAHTVIEQLAGRFIAECGLEFDEELPSSFFPASLE